MEFSITGYQMVVGLSVIGITLTVLIITLRYYFNQKGKSKSEQLWASRTKYAAYDVFKYSGVFFRAGLICALVSSILAFNYTQYDYVYEAPVFVPEDIFEAITPPIVYPEPKPIPPPPISAKNNLIIEAVEEVTQPKFVETEVKVDAVIDVKAAPSVDVATTPVLPPAPPPLPLPLPKVESVPEIVIRAEYMPSMCSSCDTKDISRKAKNECATKEMMSFVQKQLKYPTMAREVGIQGMCPVRFVVNADGSISDVELLRDIGAGCGKEALRVTKMLKNQCWQPGRQNGRKVSVQLVLPIRFKLQ